MASILELMYLLNFQFFLAQEFTNGRKHTQKKQKMMKEEIMKQVKESIMTDEILN